MLAKNSSLKTSYPLYKAVGLRIDCFFKRHHLGIMMSFECYFIGHIKAHSIVVNSW